VAGIEKLCCERSTLLKQCWPSGCARKHCGSGFLIATTASRVFRNPLLAIISEDEWLKGMKSFLLDSRLFAPALRSPELVEWAK
jgi:hypothetical protein